MTVRLVYRPDGDKPAVTAIHATEKSATAQALADFAAGGRVPLEIRDESGDNVLVGNAELRKLAK